MLPGAPSDLLVSPTGGVTPDERARTYAKIMKEQQLRQKEDAVGPFILSTLNRVLYVIIENLFFI